MVIYADVLFLVNFVSAYMLLLLIGKLIIKSKVKILRLCIASFMGGAAAVVIFTLEISLALSYFLRIFSAFIMVFTAFFEQKRQIISQVLWLFAVSLMYISAMIFLTMLTGNTTGAVIKSGVVYFDMPHRIFLPLFVLSYITVTLLMKFLQYRRAKKCYIITISHIGRKVTVTALFDSGNRLREPVTGKCVSILEWDKAKELLGAEYEFSSLGEHAEEIKLWALPYRSVGNKSGIMPAFIAEKIEILEERKVIENTFIGICDIRLSVKNEYNALLNSALL